MLTIHASAVKLDFSQNHDLKCMLVDYVSVTTAEMNQDSQLQGCTFPPEVAVSFQPAEDMVIPVFLCRIHFNSLKIGLREGVATSQDLIN